MIDRIRLFPVLALSAALIGGIKVMSVWNGMSALVPPVKAADTIKPAAAHAAEPTKSDASGVGSAEDTAAPAATDAKGATKTADAEPALRPDDDGSYSPAELQLLQSLSARRAALDKREKELDMREQVLKVTEKRVQEKMSEIKKVQKNVDAALKVYDDKQDKQLESLVKVYETMKPADAARIMDTLDMNVLIEVAQRMKERKIAPIMAAMDAATAKKLTVELATRRPLLASGATSPSGSATE